jgi:sugar lactone lactonase YvrE
MTEPQVLLNGIAFGESPRWHEGRLWFSDWSAEELLTVDLKGHRELIVRVPSFPFCFDWLPNGRLLIVSARAGAADAGARRHAGRVRGPERRLGPAARKRDRGRRSRQRLRQRRRV